MQIVPRINRQAMGCGFEQPALPGVLVTTWKPEGYKGDQPKFCAGYTTKLPSVFEIVRAHIHWGKGTLRYVCGGKPTAATLRGVETLGAAVSELQSALYTPKSKGGLADG